jgi:hypothetical protein
MLTYPLRLKRDLAVADTRPSLPKADTVVVCTSVLKAAKGDDVHPAVHNMTDMIYAVALVAVVEG